MKNFERAKGTARGVIVEQIERRSNDVGTMLGERASNLRKMRDTMQQQGLGTTANAIGYTADKVDAVATYLTQTGGDRLIHDVEELARRQPLVTGALGLLGGILAARLLKSSASDRYRAYGTGS